MNSIILESNSKSDINLIIEIAKKFKIKSRILSADEIENIGLINAMKKGETGKYIDTQNILKILIGNEYPN